MLSWSAKTIWISNQEASIVQGKFTCGVTGLAPPELLILCCRSGGRGCTGFDFTWGQHLYVDLMSFNCSGSPHMDLEGWLWLRRDSQGLVLLHMDWRRARLMIPFLHFSLVASFSLECCSSPCKESRFPLKSQTLQASQTLKAFICSRHLSSVSSPVSWSMIRTQSLAGAGSVFPWNNYDDGVITNASKGMWWWERPGQVMQNSPCKWFDQLHHCEAGWPQHFSHLSPEEQQCHNLR